MKNPLPFHLVCLPLCILLGSAIGCNDASPETVPDAATSSSAEEHDHEAGAEVAQDHSGWWCAEHGVPEEECTRCDLSLIAEYKAANDWCNDHERPATQCFLCSPELEQKYAARYEAKFGEQPPKPTDP